MTMGVFGGTFDPPHICHTLACLYALETGGLDRVVVIPCFRHPLGKVAASYEHRLAMARLAMGCLGGRVEVSDLESQRDGPSYTIDTLRALCSQHPGESLRLLVGSDILPETHLWKDFDEIQKISPVFVIPRRGQQDAKTQDTISHSFFLPDISSTEVRKRLSEGRGVEYYVAKSVLEYIRVHGIYREDPGFGDSRSRKCPRSSA